MNIAMNMTQDHLTAFSAVAQRLLIARRADQCAKWLKAQGLEVLHIERGLRTPPRIHIKPIPRCDGIDGAVQCYERGPQGERRYKMAMRFDCEVQWDDAGGAA